MHRLLAKRKIFPLGLGAMATCEYTPKASQAEAMVFFQYAARQGIELFDTADVYGLGRNEQLLGKAFSTAEKQKLILATKGGCTRPGGVDWDTDGRPSHLKEASQESLKRLQVKQIFLYQLHAPDNRVPFRESVQALKELQEQGLVKHLGLSNVSLAQLQEAEKMIEIVSVQNHFNLAVKKDERDVLPYCTKNKIAYLPYFPLGGGFGASILRHPKVVQLAQQEGITSSQLCLAWIMQKWPTAIPIPGTKNREHLEQNMAAAKLTLSSAALEKIDQISPQNFH